MSDAEARSTRGQLTDRVKGIAQTVAGTVAGNDELKREGALHHDRADAAEAASKLQASAAREQKKVDLAAREQDIAAEQERLAAEVAVDVREQQVKHEQSAGEQQIAAEAERLTASTDQQAVTQNEALDRQERHAATDLGQAEGNAAELKNKAAEADLVAADLDATVEEL